MSSVAVLTQERFNEHRSGLLPEKSGGESFQIPLTLQPRKCKLTRLLIWWNNCFWIYVSFEQTFCFLFCFGTNYDKMWQGKTLSV